jgi:hypothetical protein
MTIDPRNYRFRTIAVGAAVLGATATLAAHPAAATGIVTAVTTVSCSVTGANWCISGNNTNSGIGVIGTSKTGTGLRGTSTTQYGLKATSVSGTAILAQSASGPYGVNASAPQGYGLSGVGGFGGVIGTSTTGNKAGVIGTTTSASGFGVEGYVSSGTAVYASSDTGFGLEVTSDGGIPIYAVGGTTGNPTILAENGSTAGTAGDFRANTVGVVSRTPSNGFSFAATDANGANDEFLVDGQGNVFYHGGLFHFDIVGDGATVKSFTPNSTQPTVEDTGTAQLTSGAAAVRLDPTFAASIEARSYRVFLTPGGDTNGLFVAVKTANGFIVREARGGRSTVSFDYRIVGTALGKSGQRMALVTRAAGGFAPHLPAAALPATNRPPGIRASAAQSP